jgi:hypothetical protein
MGFQRYSSAALWSTHQTGFDFPESETNIRETGDAARLPAMQYGPPLSGLSVPDLPSANLLYSVAEFKRSNLKMNAS